MPSDGDLPCSLGRYTLYDVIGAGGMASVHIGRVRGDGGFTRTVAIKRLRGDLRADPDFVARFLDEARLSSRVRHPNVVQTLDVVTMQNELFVVMEYIHGESLDKLWELARARGERVPPDVAVTLLVGVLRGLQAAHEATSVDGQPLHVIHRDVSPQNILVGADGLPRILDFGVAKAAGRLVATREGRILGKLAYMAPEQLRGQPTRQSDIYAAAVVLWELLTGERMFLDENAANIVAAAHSADVPPPSEAKPYSGGYGRFDAAMLDAVVMRGLARDPNERFADARDMARSLEQVLVLKPPRDIGDWVEHLASPALEDRARRIERIEAVGEWPATTDAAKNRRAGASWRSPPRRWLAGTSAIGAALAVAVAASPRGSRPVATTAAGPPPPQAVASEAAELQMATDSQRTAPAPHDPPSVTQTPHAPIRPAVRATYRPSPCDPPFSLDEAGRKIFKEACLR